MNTQPAKFKRAAILLAGISAASISAMVHADWAMTGLGAYIDPRPFYANDFSINDFGQVTGISTNTNGDTHAFITGANGVGMVDLDALGIGSYPQDINNSGQVTGIFFTQDNRPHAFITGPNGVGMSDLGDFGGKIADARAINDSGQVVGQSYFAYPGPDPHAFITGNNGVSMADLGTFSSWSSGKDINNNGQVAGVSRTYLSESHAFITGPNGIGMTDLGTLGGNDSLAIGINDSGQVVGSSDAAIDIQAFVTDANGIGMINLGTLGGERSIAASINDTGQIVGMSLTAYSAGHDNHAFIFNNGGMTDLSLLSTVVTAGWNDIVVTDINNNGQVVGYGINSSGQTEAFLLSYTPDTIFTPQPIFIPTSPVPEPKTYAILLTGLGLIGFMARRRKQSA